MYTLISGSTASVRDQINALVADPLVAHTHEIIYLGRDSSMNVHVLVKINSPAA